MNKIKVLTFNGVYKPGYKGGGPVKSISNMALSLKEEVEFYIVTSDRDFGDNEPYQNINTGQWSNVDNEYVFYHSKKEPSTRELLDIIKSVNYDLVYLNGYYSNYTRKYLLLRLLGLLDNKPTILCPRGDFSEGAGNKFIKKIKKEVYIALMKFIGFNKCVKWHATSNEEKKDIKSTIGSNEKVVIAENIPNQPNDTLISKTKNVGEIELSYVSRINRKKNLLGALKLLKQLDGNITYNIYGPVFEEDYWKECLTVIKTLPKNISVNFHGTIEASKVINILSNSHFLFFPTNGENYGHIIYESLSAGCPLIISDMTPWRNLESVNVGWDIPLENEKKYIEILNKCILMTDIEYQKYRKSAKNYAISRYENDKSIKNTKAMIFDSINN